MHFIDNSVLLLSSSQAVPKIGRIRRFTENQSIREYCIILVIIISVNSSAARLIEHYTFMLTHLR